MALPISPISIFHNVRMSMAGSVGGRGIGTRIITLGKGKII
jgi:hypothetical protein